MCVQQLQNQTLQLINLEFIFHFIHIHVLVHLSCKPITKTGLVGGLYTDRSTIQLEGLVGGLYTGISTI